MRGHDENTGTSPYGPDSIVPPFHFAICKFFKTPVQSHFIRLGNVGLLESPAYPPEIQTIAPPRNGPTPVGGRFTIAERSRLSNRWFRLRENKTGSRAQDGVDRLIGYP
jgi:hypothetical protein